MRRRPRPISNTTLALVLAVIAGFADLVGGLLTVARVKATRRSILYSTAVAAGFIVAAAMLDRVPESITPENPNGPYYVLIGFLAIYLVENLFSTHAHVHGTEEARSHDPHAHEEHHGHALVSQFQPEECLISPAAATAALLGLLLHTLFDGIAIAAGFLAIYLVENLFSTHAHVHGTEEARSHDPHAHEEHHGHALVSQFQPEECLISPAAATAALLGLLLHTLFDGIAIAAGFLASRHTGFVMFLAVIFHKLPEGFSASALMLSSGRSPRWAVYSAGMLGVSTILGAVLASVVGALQAGWAQTFLTLATGSFLYIGCSDMIPATNKGQDRRAVLLVIVGVAIFIGSSWALRAAGFLEH